MSIDLDPRIRTYVQAAAAAQDRVDPAVVRASAVPSPIRRRGVSLAVAAATVVVTLIGGVALLTRFAPGASEDATSQTTIASESASTVVRSDSSGGTPFPDVEAAVPGDDGGGPLPLGAVTTLPDSVQLDFLFELCWTPNCFRDAHFIDPSGTGLGSGGFEPDTPFHVREGFPVAGGAPLGDGFDVVLYVTPLDVPGEFGGVQTGPTLRYTADYVVLGETDACGPAYETQTGSITCEWFVHEFPIGLPEGRHAIWAVWEAPCWAWVDYGFVESCTDPDEVMSLFDSGFDAPFAAGASSYIDADGAESTIFQDVLDNGAAADQMLPVADPSGAAPTGGTPLPDFEAAIAGDSGRPAIALGQVTSLPEAVPLDFLYEICWPDVCFRDAHFMDPGGSGLGSGVFPAGEPFFIREGFPVHGEEPLGDGFQVVVYVTPMDHAGEFGGRAAGTAVRYTADYRIRVDAAGCGPTYRSQDAPTVCEWFVHEFPDGLPSGRHAIWAVWEAPCSAWVDYGFVESCTDATEVMSLFGSGFDAPFGVPADYSEADQRPTG